MSNYLVFSFILGNAFMMWVFFDNRENNPGSAMFVMVSCGFLVLGYLAKLGVGMRPIHPSESGLREPLLGSDAVEQLVTSSPVVQSLPSQARIEIESFIVRALKESRQGHLAAFSNEDEGKWLTITDSDVLVNFSVRNVNWGGVKPNDVEGTITSVDPTYRGKVELEGGQVFENGDQGEELDLHGMQLEYLPDSIGKFTSLCSLDLTNNRLTKLPMSLLLLTNLQTLKLEGNPLLEPPADVCTKGRSAVFTFLRALQDCGRAPLRFGRWLLLGDPGAGKSTLFSFMLGQRPRLFRSTDGIDIETLRTWIQLPGSAAELEVQIDLWDFAGREEYFSTHEYFIPTSDLAIVLLLYKVVSGAALDVERLSFWLAKVQSHCPSATVFVVGTHATKEQLNAHAQIMKAKSVTERRAAETCIKEVLGSEFLSEWYALEQSFSSLSLSLQFVDSLKDMGIEHLKASLC